jgi:hypothetical protein
MNEQRTPAVPDENRIEELLGKIQPVPSERFHERMRLPVWQTENPGSPVRRVREHRIRLALSGILLLVLAVFLVTPRGRAWAQEVFHFFNRINSQTVELPESQMKLLTEGTNDSFDLPLVPVFIPTVSPEIATLPGCETPEKSQSYRCQIAWAESQLGFDLKEFPEVPENWGFESLSFDPASNSAITSYILDQFQTSGSFLLMQGLGDFSKEYSNVPWEVVPADKVESVKVGEYSGEYVKGSFGKPENNRLAWSDAYLHRLAWSDGTRWYSIKVWPNPTMPDSFGRDRLIELAESLVDAPKEISESANPDPLYTTVYSISEAEKISGVDLKTPTLLPMGIHFEYARKYSYNDEVRLFYGTNNELVIHAWKGKSLDVDRLSAAPNENLKVVSVNGEKALLGSAEGSHTRLFLWWEDDGMYYQMYYYLYFGQIIDKEELIAIAESMQDINDFRMKDSRPYEYVTIYEKALGLNAREFPKTPAGWSFGSVWADPHAQCITLMYRSGNEPGWLSINQCTKDKYYNVSDIPPRVIEQVRIGRKEGVYTRGDFVTRDNGTLTWDPDLPVQQLHWQEDELWIEITMYGQTVIHSDKKDLIAYAESLR